MNFVADVGIAIPHISLPDSLYSLSPMHLKVCFGLPTWIYSVLNSAGESMIVYALSGMWDGRELDFFFFFFLTCLYYKKLGKSKYKYI